MKTSKNCSFSAIHKTVNQGLKKSIINFKHVFPFVLILSVILTLAPVKETYSQFTPGIYLGYNHAIFGGPDAKAWGFMDTDPLFTPRFQLGLLLLTELTENLFLEPGLLFATKGTRYVGEFVDWDNNTFELIDVDRKLQKRLSYLNIPITARYFFDEKLSVGLGPEISFLLSAQAIANDTPRGQSGNAVKSKTDVRNEYRIMDLSFRLAVSYFINQNLYMQLGYLHGLNDIVKYGDDDEYYDYKSQGLPGRLKYNQAGYYDDYDDYDYGFNVKNRGFQLSLGYFFNR